ncbi:PREDICTED: uncharacterized protein LOC106790844 isoform X2 [Polistes canadensis]|uniref:uncharacterized protein LOC106790844 isoform X2 n=2 Tax=Polistes canadensis TaxID=91411 RepID=UPI000718B31F|nr:PREDICTED: uncharacterized protein LOC106790844 isoform X2 [Polistes canadensis]XP_014611539.1 PREDICTED: uncharacterized protein LOC106790844 isoform X2 [Polistes canadensis]
MNNLSETTSSEESDENTADYFDNDISDKDKSKEDSNTTKNSSSDHSNLHNSSQKSKSPLRSNERKKNNIEDNKNINWSKLLIYMFPVLVLILVYNIYKHPLLTSNHHEEDNDGLTQTSKQILQNNRIQEFRKSVASVKSKFKSQTSYTWNAFQSQVEDVINENSKVSIVILLGNETNTIKCFAHLLGDVSSKVLGNNNYLLLNTKNIGNDHGEVISKWKADILRNKVVIIEDLLSMESESIKALHNLCDKENPLVSKAFYIITIMSNSYQGLHKDKFVEDSLTTKFSKTIDLDILNPLIIRIMDGPIIPIVPESKMKEKHNIEECLLL